MGRCMVQFNEPNRGLNKGLTKSLSKGLNKNLSSNKVKIENLINDNEASGSIGAPGIVVGVIGAQYPPNIIVIQDFEPLRLAKKKHYKHFQAAVKIQKRTGAKKPQGRPFNSNLNARFLLFSNVDDMILNLLGIKEINLGVLDISNGNSSGINCGFGNGGIFAALNFFNNVQFHKTCNESPFYQLKAISFEQIPDSSFLIHNELCKIFNIEDFSFVKTIRNHKGKLIKFEILSSVDSNELNIDFIKKFITYPRYKSKMKIFIINQKFNSNVWFYNDLRMLIWDLENLNIRNTKILLNNDILK